MYKNIFFFQFTEAIKTLLSKINTRSSLSLIMDAPEHRMVIDLKRLYNVFSSSLNVLQYGNIPCSMMFLAIIQKITDG